MWRDILKQEISLLEILNEEIEEGYTILEVNGSWRVRADKHGGIEFRLDDLHYRLGNSIINGFLGESDYSQEIRRRSRLNPTNLGDEKTEQFIFQVKAAVRGLEFFLGAVARNGDLDSIRGDYIKSMVLEGPTGIIITFRLSKESNCHSNIQYRGKMSTMCLRHDISEQVPAAGDSWYTLYTVFNLVKDEQSEDTIATLTDSGRIPNVIRTAYDAVRYEEYEATCGHCNHPMDDGELRHLICSECGYSLYGEDEEIISEEDENARITLTPNGWHCPYDEEFTGYDERCDEHGVKPVEGGPNYGYEIEYASWLPNTGLYMVEGENLFVTDPGTGYYEEYTKDQLLEREHLEPLLLDFKELFGDVEDGLDYLGIGPWEEVGDNITFEYDGDRYIFYNNTNTLVPYDERFDEVGGYIISSGIDVEINIDIPFEDALDEVIEKVEEIIEFEEMEAATEEEASEVTRDAKELLLKLESMK